MTFPVDNSLCVITSNKVNIGFWMSNNFIFKTFLKSFRHCWTRKNNVFKKMFTNAIIAFHDWFSQHSIIIKSAYFWIEGRLRTFETLIFKVCLAIIWKQSQNYFTEEPINNFQNSKDVYSLNSHSCHLSPFHIGK